MNTAVYEELLAYKRKQMRHHENEYLRFKEEADVLEETLDRGEVPVMPIGTTMKGEPCMSKKEKSEVRMQQVLALFKRKSSGIVFVEDVMHECKITKNPAKEWMNSRIELDPDGCPWERVDGIKTMFVLKPNFVLKTCQIGYHLNDFHTSTHSTRC